MKSDDLLRGLVYDKKGRPYCQWYRLGDDIHDRLACSNCGVCVPSWLMNTLDTDDQWLHDPSHHEDDCAWANAVKYLDDIAGARPDPKDPLYPNRAVAECIVTELKYRRLWPVSEVFRSQLWDHLHRHLDGYRIDGEYDTSVRTDAFIEDMNIGGYGWLLDTENDWS